MEEKKITKVSVITATYNSGKEILETYNSLVEQTFSSWEWVVTDDCSTDDTLKILQRFSEADDRVTFLSNIENAGAAVSRNKSLNKANGEFIAFIDSDDIWLPHKLEKQVKFMEENNLDFSFTAYELINEQGKKLGKQVDTHLKSFVTYECMLKKKATLGCSTVMLRRHAFKDISMPLLRTGQDYATWLKLLKTGINAQPLVEVLTLYRILPNSISRNKLKKARRQWQIYREVEKLPLLNSATYFLFYAWRAVFRK